MTPENLLAEWSRLLFESLADAGVRDVVVSPGSRSTPLVWAALAASRLRATSIVDERAAGFFALGHARVTGVPAVVVCTSGSAAANYFPAIVEAKSARVPLIVVTADRPFELMDAGASQTMDQTKLYGDYVRRFVDVGMPEPAAPALSALRRVAAQAVYEAAHGEAPGPVHLNVRARKPLEPAPATSPEGVALRERVTALLGTPIVELTPPRRLVSDDAVNELATALSGAERGLIACGPAGLPGANAAAALDELSRATGFPVYAETTSQLRLAGGGTTAPADGLDLLLRVGKIRDALRGVTVLQIGEAPTSGAWERFVASTPSLVRHVLTSHGHPDPSSRARSIVVGDVADALGRIAHGVRVRRGTAPTRFAEAAARASKTAFDVVDALLAEEASLSEGTATRTVIDALPPGSVLAVGNSLPVRHVDAFVRARSDANVRVWSQRGVSGIDGVVAGAAGAARAAHAPTVLLVGDVSAWHDVGAFAVAASLETPFVVVVLDNDGGRIFEQLPFADTGVSEDQFRFWTTPHGRTFEGVAPLFSVRHRFAKTRSELHAALSIALAQNGCTVIEVPVPPHGAREQYRALTARLDAALGPLAATLAG